MNFQLNICLNGRKEKAMANKPPIVEIKFEEGEATFDEVVKACTEMVMLISKWDFGEDTPNQEAKAS